MCAVPVLYLCMCMIYAHELYASKCVHALWRPWGDAGVSFITLRPISLRHDLSLGPELAVSITMVTGKS